MNLNPMRYKNGDILTVFSLLDKCIVEILSLIKNISGYI